MQVNGRVPSQSGGAHVLDSPALRVGAWSQVRHLAAVRCMRCMRRSCVPPAAPGGNPLRPKRAHISAWHQNTSACAYCGV